MEHKKWILNYFADEIAVSPDMAFAQQISSPTNLNLGSEQECRDCQTQKVQGGVDVKSSDIYFEIDFF